MLQEKNAKAGEHLIRARGPWFGNRSVSAEVDLEAGVYEVVPKIVATRDADAPEVLSVVKKLAQSNPQKLRQIGMNYDMANAKGVFELPEEDKKKKEQEKKDLEEKKAKEKEAEEKEKAEFEAWKKEEKAAYEAWKKSKEDKDKEKAKEVSESKEEVRDSKTQTEQSDAPTGPNANAEEAKDKTAPDSEENKAAVTADLPPQPADSEPKSLTADTVNPATQDTKDTPDHVDPAHPTPTPDASASAPTSLPPASKSTSLLPPPPPPPTHLTPFHPPVFGDAPIPPRDTSSPGSKQDPKPWNAVCTLGLRVYTLDPNVTIQLVKPQTDEETAILDVDGGTQAGATM